MPEFIIHNSESVCFGSSAFLCLFVHLSRAKDLSGSHVP